MITVYRGRPSFSAAAQFQNFVAFGFQVQGASGFTPPPTGTTGYIKEFYWNDHLTHQTQHMLRFGFKVQGTSGATTQGTAGTGGNIGAGGYFSKGRWHQIRDELEAARRARLEVIERARRTKQQRAKRILNEAARLAKEAFEAAEANQLVELTTALEAAAGAKRVTDAVIEAQRVKEIALAQIAHHEAEDEDDAEALLLS